MAQHVEDKTALMKFTLYTLIVSFTRVTGKPIPVRPDDACGKTAITTRLLDLFRYQVNLTENTYCSLVNKTYPCDYHNACSIGSDYKPSQYRSLNFTARLSKNYALLSIFEKSLKYMTRRREKMKGRKNYNFALKFHELWRSIRDAQLKIDECLETCFSITPGKSTRALGNQLFMQFPQDQTDVPLCKGSREEQELFVLKHLGIVYTEIIIDFATRKVASNDNDRDRIFCS